MFWSLPSREVDDVFTGTSGSLLLHPREFIESRNEADAIAAVQTVLSRCQATRYPAACTSSEKPVFAV